MYKSRTMYSPQCPTQRRDQFLNLRFRNMAFAGDKSLGYAVKRLACDEIHQAIAYTTKLQHQFPLDFELIQRF
jgi:hypothetical protein